MREPREIGAELRAWMRRQGLSESALAKRIYKENRELAVSQSWISRISAGKFRRLTPKIRYVADYANIRVIETAERDARGARLISEAVSDAWNGSFSHANVIARLIRVGKGLASED